MSNKYKEIDELKSKIEDLNTLLRKIQESNFVLRLTVSNDYNYETQINSQQIVISEVMFTERVI